MGQIESGIFIMPFHDPAKPLAQCYDEDLELAVRADELGFREFWIGEHHTMAYENIPMPELFIAAAMRQTQNIRMGPAPVCLQQHHPVLVASRLAMLDHLCKGRLDLCFGPGSVSTDMEILGIEPNDSSEMVAEAAETILQLWSSDGPIDIDGKYWRVRMEEHVDLEVGLGIVHKPYQRPHPPISMPISSWNSGTGKFAGRMGFQPFAHSLIPSNTVANIWETYAASSAEVGRTADRSDFKIARAVFLADSTEEAQRIVRTNSLGAGFRYIGELLDRGGRGRGMMKRDRSMPDAECGFDYWMGEQIIAGDVDYATERVLEMMEETGEFGVLVMMAYDWDDKERWIHSMELFAKELMPSIDKAVGAAVL